MAGARCRGTFGEAAVALIAEKFNKICRHCPMRDTNKDTVPTEPVVPEISLGISGEYHCVRRVTTHRQRRQPDVFLSLYVWGQGRQPNLYAKNWTLATTPPQGAHARLALPSPTQTRPPGPKAADFVVPGPRNQERDCREQAGEQEGNGNLSVLLLEHLPEYPPFLSSGLNINTRESDGGGGGGGGGDAFGFLDDGGGDDGGSGPSDAFGFLGEKKQARLSCLDTARTRIHVIIVHMRVTVTNILARTHSQSRDGGY
eukprot:1328636-Amorphochlora_amoeboformis.AAC.2